MNRRRVLVVFRKEMTDALRDRRSLLTALLAPPIIMAVAFVGIVAFGRTALQVYENTIELPVVGAEHAPELMSFLRQNNVTVGDAPVDPEGAVRARRADAVLVVPPSFGDEIARGRQGSVRLIYDEARDRSGHTQRRVSRLLEAYGERLGAMRLLLRGINPGIAQGIAVAHHDLATPADRAMLFLGMLPMMMVFSLLMGGLYVAIDATAGERERSSLEPLLTNPVTREDLVLGKLATAGLFSLVGGLLAVATYGIICRLVPPGIQSSLDMQLRAAPGPLLMMALAFVPLAFFCSAVQMLVASFCRSFKEAQTYASLVIVMPMLFGLSTLFNAGAQSRWMLAVPMLAEQTVCKPLLAGNLPAGGDMALAMCSSCAWAVLITAVVIRLYKNEAILFARGMSLSSTQS